MRKKGFKGRCEKRVLSKCKEVCRTYDPLQSAYLQNWLQVLKNDKRFIVSAASKAEKAVELILGAAG